MAGYPKPPDRSKLAPEAREVLKTYDEDERDHAMGSALQRAESIYRLVKKVTTSEDDQIKALAVLLRDWRKEGISSEQDARLQETRAHAAGLVRKLKNEADALVGRIERGELL